MTNDKFEKPLDDHSNAAMTHTSEGIALLILLLEI